jgi:hypothetical protein
LTHTLREWRLYQRKNSRTGESKIVKKDDHAMDALRYLIVSGMERARACPGTQETDWNGVSDDLQDAWML